MKLTYIKIGCGLRVMDLLGILINQIGFFTTLLVLGFLSVKLGFISDDNVTALSRIMLRVVVPFMVLTLVVESGTREELFSMGPYFLAVFVMFAVLILVAFLSGKAFGFSAPVLNVHICSAAFVNSALLGYPIILVMFPEEAGLAIATYLVAETVIMWTAGITILTYGKEGKGIDFKKMITPMTVSLAVALVMLLLNFKPKGVVWDSLYGFGAIQKYLGLLYIGMDIGRRGLKKLFEKPKVLLTIPIKLIVGPLAVFFILRALNIVSYNQLIILTIFSMLPSMMIITMLAQEYDCMPEYASAALLGTTVFSLLTMPFVFWLVTEVL